MSIYISTQLTAEEIATIYPNGDDRLVEIGGVIFRVSERSGRLHAFMACSAGGDLCREALAVLKDRPKFIDGVYINPQRRQQPPKRILAKAWAALCVWLFAARIMM